MLRKRHNEFNDDRPDYSVVDVLRDEALNDTAASGYVMNVTAPQPALTEPAEPPVEPPVPLLEEAKTLPLLGAVVAELGWDDVPEVIVPGDLKVKIAEGFAGEMHIIEDDYHAAAKEFRNQCRAFDEKECKLRRPLSV
jgi:hypothetical protein